MFLTPFLEEQLAKWPEAAARYADLAHVEVRSFGTTSAQFNPARMVSTGAKVDKATLAKRPCFLCKANRPAVQKELGFGYTFDVLVNPFPILPAHFTIATKRHCPQALLDSFAAFYRLADIFTDALFFYNGPKCGASAPDHLHFQGGDGGVVPLYRDWEKWQNNLQEVSRLNASNRICTLQGYPVPVLVILSNDFLLAELLFRRVYMALPCHEDETEPMLNAMIWGNNEGEVVTLIFPRQKHRPDCYYATGEQQMLISPGALDMAGLVITPRKEDFDRLTATQIEAILAEVALSGDAFAAVVERLHEPMVSVGIVKLTEMECTLQGVFTADGMQVTGLQHVKADHGKLIWQEKEYDWLTFAPLSRQASFTLSSVTIGIGFHWERQEAQTFEGMMRLEAVGEQVLVINELPVERYLASVISSEMRATSSIALLQAHAVVSRSWLFTQMAHRVALRSGAQLPDQGWENINERIRWYDRNDHVRFDVCADDHCQRYQGTTRVISKHVDEAIKHTYGQVLWDGNAICDARFSKCCGGATELFSTCWQDEDKPYLAAFRDLMTQEQSEPQTLPDLTDEQQARRWILSSPPAFCNTQDKGILAQVLNGYDQETADFYRWSVRYTQAELQHIIEEKTGLLFGKILALDPLSRGKSGRIIRLRIVGVARTLVIGKELEIRRTLSNTHLKSSAFIVETEQGDNGIPTAFILRGAGWGHGVGLCQIGAAMMGAKGYDYTAILNHYYPRATLRTLYKPTNP